MKHLSTSIIPLLMLICLSACNMGGNQNGNNGDQASEEKQTSSEKANEKSEPTSNKAQKQNIPYDGYQWASNERFDFKIAIPKDWQVLKTSDNQDGFHIGADQEGVDIRCYGETLNAAVKSFDKEICQNSKGFSYLDDAQGKKCIDGNEWYFFRPKNEDERVTLYVKSPKTWLKEHKAKIHKIAKSMTFQKMAT